MFTLQNLNVERMKDMRSAQRGYVNLKNVVNWDIQYPARMYQLMPSAQLNLLVFVIMAMWGMMKKIASLRKNAVST